VPDLYVAIDAHRVFSQIVRIAIRYSLEVYIVTHDFLSMDDCVHLIAAQEGQVDLDWIAANIQQGDICVTEAPQLADRCTLRGAQAFRHPVAR
jgi:uncharacterized protein YaiI (UPF0178 family)